MTAAPASFSRRHVFLAFRIPQTRGDALTRVPKQVERGRDGLRPVFDVRTVLLGKVRLQSGGDLVSGPQRRLHRIEALGPGIGPRRSRMTVWLHINSTPRSGRRDWRSIAQTHFFVSSACRPADFKSIACTTVEWLIHLLRGREVA
jgi:hypothetical protein